MHAVIKASELSTSMMGTNRFPMTPLHDSGTSSEPSMLFCLIVVLKACELADAIATTILPPARSHSYPNTLNQFPTEPVFEPKPLHSPIDDCIWSANGASSPHFTSNPTKLSDEHITGLIRFDIHLSHLNRFIATFTQFSVDQSLPSDTAVAARYRRRLSQLHTQIRMVVDATIPAWD